MIVLNRRLTQLAAVLALGLGLAGPSPASGAASTTPEQQGIEVGIADQKPDMFKDKRFAELGIRYARFSMAWDALSSRWQTDELDAWMTAAQVAGVEPLITFQHSRTNRRAKPTPAGLRRQFRKLRRRYPWATTFATWNEANLCGEPTCRRPSLAAGYYRALRKECSTCTILAPELLDMPNMVRWARDFRKALGYQPKIWGVHNYVEANRFRQTRLRRFMRAMPRSKVWLTETGGLVRRDNASTTDIPEGPRHAGEVTRYIFDRILPSNPRIKRVYIYHWNAGPPTVTWDSGLINPSGGKRSALFVLARVLRFGLRPQAPFRSQAAAAAK